MEENFNQQSQSNNKMKLVLLLGGAIIFALVGYIIFNKVLKKEPSQSSKINNETKEVKTLNLTDEVVKKLVYPKYNNRIETFIDEYPIIWDFIDIELDEIKRDYRMLSVSDLVKKEQNKDETLEYSEYAIAEEFEITYHKIFGPDQEYSDGSLSDGYSELCGPLTSYDATKKIYHNFAPCGYEGGNVLLTIKDKAFKAEQDGDNIYVYHNYVYILSGTENNNYYFDHLPIKDQDYTLQDNEIIKTVPTAIYHNENLEEGFNYLINNNKLNTYRYTFKKQSDGNYYFASGKIVERVVNEPIIEQPHDETSVTDDSISLNDPIIENLLYPKYNTYLNNMGLDGGDSGIPISWEYIDIDVKNLSRDMKMISASEYAKPEQITSSEELYYTQLVTAEEFKKGFEKLFGPEVNYTDGKLDSKYSNVCGLISIYDAKRNVYTDAGPCGFECDESCWYVYSVKMPYKATKTNDVISVYFHYVYVIEYNDGYIYLYNNRPLNNKDYTYDDKTHSLNNIKNYILKEQSNNSGHINAAEEVLKKVINIGKASEYKYEFTKQSDGNYYFSSGKVIK